MKGKEELYYVVLLEGFMNMDNTHTPLFPRQAYSTIWVREHNRVCDELLKVHPNWDDERIYQTARLIIVGECRKGEEEEKGKGNVVLEISYSVVSSLKIIISIALYIFFFIYSFLIH